MEEEKDWKEEYIRLYADFDNYKKRMVREKDDIRKNVKVETLSSVLELDNDLHIATKYIKDEKSLNAIQTVTDKLHSFLKKNGIEIVPTDTYDEDNHEVVSVVETGSTGVMDVVSKGYKLNGVIIKHPKIILSK